MIAALGDKWRFAHEPQDAAQAARYHEADVDDSQWTLASTYAHRTITMLDGRGQSEAA